MDASSTKGRVVVRNLWGENGEKWRIAFCAHLHGVVVLQGVVGQEDAGGGVPQLAALLLLTILLVWLCLSGTGESGLTVVEITAPVWAVDTPEPSTTKTSAIIFTYSDGRTATYTVTETMIYINTADWRLPAADGNTLVLVTCYPFRYSGSAPGKYQIVAVMR
mgnify:CR=1 FL=1